MNNFIMGCRRIREQGYSTQLWELEGTLGVTSRLKSEA